MLIQLQRAETKDPYSNLASKLWVGDLPGRAGAKDGSQHVPWASTWMHTNAHTDSHTSKTTHYAHMKKKRRKKRINK